VRGGGVYPHQEREPTTESPPGGGEEGRGAPRLSEVEPVAVVRVFEVVVGAAVWVVKAVEVV
jgi:hypothetical protein